MDARDLRDLHADALQRQLESAILRADEQSIRDLLGRGASVDRPPLDRQFSRLVYPEDDSALTILARVIASGDEVCKVLKFDREPGSDGRNGNPGWRTHDVRWMDVRRLLIAEGGGPSGWLRVPKGWGSEEYVGMSEVCAGLFGERGQMSVDGNTFIDVIVRKQAGIEKATYPERLKQMLEDLGSLLDALDVGKSARQLERVALRLLAEGDHDIELRRADSGYFIAFCILLDRIGAVSQDGVKVLSGIAWGAGQRRCTPLELATKRIRGVDHGSVLEKLLASGVDPDQAAPHTGKTPLMGSVEGRSLPSISALLQAGADLSRKDKKGRTAEDYLPEDDDSDLVATIRAYLRAWGARSTMASIGRGVQARR